MMYEPCPWCASRAFAVPCPEHGATYQRDALPVTFTEPVSHTFTTGCDALPFGALCARCNGPEINPQHHDPGGLAPAPWHSFDPAPTTCPACLDELGTELEAEYRAAVLHVEDRAQEARIGGRLYRMLANDPRYRPLDVYVRDFVRASRASAD